MKVGAFLLGMLFGIILIFAALGGAIWYAVAVLTPDQVTNNQASDYVGDYGKMSLKDIYDDVMKKFEDCRGKYYDYDRDEDGNIKYNADGKPVLVEVAAEKGGQYMTLGMFCATSGINLKKILNGKELPQSFLDVPVMEYFNGTDGAQRALSQIKVSVLPDIVNMFTTTGADGKPMVNQAAIDKLANYSVVDLTSENGIETVFSQVKLADLVNQYFPQTSESGKELLFALGQSTVGGILKSMRGGNFLAEIKSGGQLEHIGNIKVTQLISETDVTMQNAFGDATIGSLVDNDGKLSMESLIDQIKVGSIMGYNYEKETNKWYTIGASGNKLYVTGSMATLASLSIKDALNVDSFKGLYLGELLGYVRIQQDVSAYSVYGETTDVMYNGTNYAKADGDKWYIAKLNCTDTHTHTSNCFAYAWYTPCIDETHTTLAEHAAGGDVYDNGQYYKEATGVFAALSNATLADLMNGSTDSINDLLQNVKLSDVLGDNIPTMFKSLKDTAIKDIGTAVKTLRIGQMLEYTREDLTASANDYTAVGTLADVKSSGSDYIKADGDYWYKAKLTCDDEKHDALTKHTSDCFDYVWTKDGAEPEGVFKQMASLTIDQLSDSTQLNNRIQEIKLGDVMTINDTDKPLGALKNVKIKNLNSSFEKLTLADVMTIDSTSAYALRSLANTPINQMGDKFNTLKLSEVVEINATSPKLLQTLKDKQINNLSDSLNDLKLGEVIEIDSTSSPMLKALADKQVNNLANEIDTMKMGIMLGYTTATSDSHSTADHWHDGEGNLVKGIYAKIADKTVKDMSGNGMKDVVGGLTMGDLLDSGMMDLGEGDAGKNNEYKLAIIYCQGAHSNSLTSKRCTLENYFVYKTANSSDTMSAMNFYLLCHDVTNESELTPTQTAHRDVWKQATLDDFITMLFSVL